MRPQRPSVKHLEADGLSITAAVQAALGKHGVTKFARKLGIHHSAVSNCIHGRQRHEMVRDALSREPIWGRMQPKAARRYLDTRLDALMASRRAAVAGGRKGRGKTATEL